MGICWANGERLVIANADGTLSEVLAGEARSPATTRLALAGHALFTRSDGAGLAECARAYRAALLEAAEGAEATADGGGGGEEASQLYAAHVVWEFCEAVYLSDGTSWGRGERRGLEYGFGNSSWDAPSVAMSASRFVLGFLLVWLRLSLCCPFETSLAREADGVTLPPAFFF